MTHPSHSPPTLPPRVSPCSRYQQCSQYRQRPLFTMCPWMGWHCPLVCMSNPPMSAFSNDSCMTFCTSHAPCSFTKMACMRTHAHPFSGPTWSHSACRAGTGPWCLCHAHVVWPYCMTYSQSHTDGRPMYDICTCHASCSWTPCHHAGALLAHARTRFLALAWSATACTAGTGQCYLYPEQLVWHLLYVIQQISYRWYTHVWHCLL